MRCLKSVILHPPWKFLNYPGTSKFCKMDLEKWGDLKPKPVHTATSTSSNVVAEDNVTSSLDSLDRHSFPRTLALLSAKLAKWNVRVESLSGLEARGVTRVLPEEKHDGRAQGYLQMLLLWFSINLGATNITTGLLGPLLFSLGWVDCVCIVIFANAISSCAVAYISTFGPQSGNRTMVCLRARVHISDLLASRFRWRLIRITCDLNTIVV